jgi:HAE1 family hydrophobic/amphiphilic exporter-1
VHLLSIFSLRNRALIALITIVVGVFGGVALTQLKQELIPTFSLPQLFVITSYPGASPSVVEKDVSTPIEEAIQTVEGLEGTTATSSASFSSITVEFAYGTNIATAEQKVQLAINRIQLPDAADTQVLTFSFSDLPVIQIGVVSDLDPNELSQRLEASTVVELKKLDAVSDVSLLGTTQLRLVITPDPAQLAGRGLGTQAIRDALDSNGVLLPAGQITENEQTLTVQAGARIASVDEVAGLPLLGGRTPTTIADIATVELVEDPITSISRVNGEPALTVAITKSPAGNTVAVSQAVREALPELEAAIGDGTRFTVVFDQAPFIEQSINSLAQEGLLGLVFAVIIILVFLLSLRSTLVTAISIPVSVLITFIGMWVSGYTLNIITLGALTIAIGRVVDDSIVVIENIKRHLGLGEPKLAAIKSAVREVAGAVTASTLTTVAVFLPLALVGDITGELFRPFALTVTIALAASLFVALTIVPVLAYWFLREPKPAAHAAAASTADELDTPTFLQRGYLPVLRGTLRHPVLTIAGAVLILALTVPVGLFGLKTNFLGDSGQNTLTVRQTLPLGASLEARDDAAQEVEAAIVDLPGVETVQTSIGSGGNSLRAAFAGTGSTTFSITTDESFDQVELQQTIRDAVSDLGEDAGEVTLSAGGGGGFSSRDVEVNITAASSDDLAEATETVLDAMRDLPIVAEATSNLSEEQPFVEIRVDRVKAAELGLSEVAVGGIITQAMNPSSVGEVVLDDDVTSIYILNSDAPVTLQQIRDFTILPGVMLSELATVDEVEGPSSVTTIKGVRSGTVTVTPSSDDVGTASTQIQAELDELELPAGATTELGGVTAQQSDAFSQLSIAGLVAILIVYVIMVATFRSLRQPLLLLVSIPFAATGAILLQWASGIPLGVASIIGVIMLIGIVVTNAIVLIDLVNQYRERGLSTRDAVVHGASRRLRPILMTAAATIFALLPLGIGITGHGGFISQPLAIIVIGGLVSSTTLTLVVLPVLYYLVEGARERRDAKRSLVE